MTLRPRHEMCTLPTRAIRYLRKDATVLPASSNDYSLKKLLFELSYSFFKLKKIKVSIWKVR